MSSADYRSIPAGSLPPKDMYHLLNSVVVPRPIAWVSSLSEAGVANIAPHSFFTIASTDPAVLMFTSVGLKDTVVNIRETREFVIHIVDHSFAERMNVTAADAPHEIDEFTLAGLERCAAELVSAPRVVDAPVAIECALDEIVEKGNCALVFGRVLTVHVAERLWDSRDRVDPGLLDAIARMGGATYSTTRDRFDLKRPTYADLQLAD